MTLRKTCGPALTILLTVTLAGAALAGQGPGNGPAAGGGTCADPTSCIPVGTGPYGPPSATPGGPASGNGPGSPAGPNAGPGAGCSQQGQGEALLAYLGALPTGSLTEAQAAWILMLREEEKLARDLYLALADRWPVAAFANVARAEQRHFDLMGAMIARYGLGDPAFGQLPGSFTSSVVQTLHDELLALGNESAVAALSAAARVEETDLADLSTIEATAPPADLLTVDQNLARGSRNHLRGFVAALAAQGATYEPTVLSAEQFAAIVGSETERGAVDAMGEPLPGSASCNPPSD